MFGYLKSSLLKTTGIYTATSIINAAIPFLLIPILTRQFNPVDYGIIAMATILINIITPIVGFSSHGAIHRRYFEKDKSSTFPRYVGNGFVILFLSSLIISLVIIIFGDLISKHTLVPLPWLYVILLIAICQYIVSMLLTIWQAKVKAIYYGSLRILQSILNIGLSLVFILELHFGWEGRILGQFYAVLGIAFFCIVYLVKFEKVIFKFNSTDIKDILSFSLPLVPHTLGGLLIGFTDRILITNVIGIEETGIYTVAFQIGSVLSVLNTSFMSAYIPWLYGKLELNRFDVKLKIVKFTYIYFLLNILYVIICSFLLPFLFKYVVGEDFNSANTYTIWIILGFAFNGMYLVISGFIFYTKKTFLLSRVTLVMSLINIPVCYFMLVHYGTVGAGISMCIIYFISFICIWYLSNKVYRMPWLKIWNG